MRFIYSIPDWLIYFLLLALIIGNVSRGSTRTKTPAPPPKLGPSLPNVKPTDTTVLVELDAPHSGVGTAFATDAKGGWMTARHVVDGCDQVGLRLENRKYVKMDTVRTSKKSDTAFMKSRWKREPLAQDFRSQRNIGEHGFFMGFPQGKPGELAGKLLGRHRMMVRGRYRTSEPILAWTEMSRSRGLEGSIGGLSGGPVFDADGEVIGLVAAESPRRGRIYTVAPRSLDDELRDLTKQPKRDGIDVKNYGRRADTYRRDRRIAQVVCVVK